MNVARSRKASGGLEIYYRLVLGPPRMKKFMVVFTLLAACTANNLQPGTGSIVQATNLVTGSIYEYLAAGFNDDWMPYNTQAVQMMIPDASGSTLTGVDHTYFGDGDLCIVRNTDPSVPLVLASDSTRSATANRFHFRDGLDITLLPGESIWLQADYQNNNGGYVTVAQPQTLLVELSATNSRTLGSTFQPDTTHTVAVHYSVSISSAISISGGQAGRIELRVGTSNSLSGSDAVARVDAGLTGTAVIGLALTSVVGGELTYVVPAGDWVEVVGVNVTGTPTYTLVAQREQAL